MGRTLVFDGFLRVTGLPQGDEPILPALAEGQALGPVDVVPSQHFTLPPPRYTEASLVKTLEAEGIGRPSTYASIISTIQDRKYVRLMNRAFMPTDLGKVVTDKLVAHFPQLFDVRFTARMEDQLDKVEERHEDWLGLLRNFYGPFKTDLTAAAANMVHARAESKPSDYKCDECGKPMAYRFSKNGRYLACTGYPECKTTYPVDESGQRVTKQTVDLACPKCKAAMVLRKGRFGAFLSCSRYPDCDGIVKLDKKGVVKPPTAPPLQVDVPCPKCQAPLYLRRSARGPWLSCSKYPKCRGRQAWVALDDPVKKALSTALEAHEAANPVSPLTRLGGTPLPPRYTPGAEAPNAEAGAVGEAGADASSEGGEF
jgi:DNA topoisomerase-1